MMEAVTNKTLEKWKYELVRDGLVQYEVLEQAENIANAENINISIPCIANSPSSFLYAFSNI